MSFEKKSWLIIIVALLDLPQTTLTLTLFSAADNTATVWADGVQIATMSGWSYHEASFPRNTQQLAFSVRDTGGEAGLIAEIPELYIVTNSNGYFRCTSTAPTGDDWKYADFDDTTWQIPASRYPNGDPDGPWAYQNHISADAFWIWTSPFQASITIYCRVNLIIDDCQDVTCSDVGTCVDDVGEFICNCPMGYRGDQCQESGTGDCPTGSECQCHEGWSGPDCGVWSGLECPNWDLMAFSADAIEGYRDSQIKHGNAFHYDIEQTDLQRGFTVLTIKRRHYQCSFTGTTTYDFIEDTSGFIAYMESVLVGDVVLGVSASNVYTGINPVRPTFDSFHINMDDLQFRSSATFVAVRTSATMRYQNVASGMAYPAQYRMKFSASLGRFEIIERDRKPTATPFITHLVHSSTQCSMLCRRNTNCYSIALEPNLETESNRNYCHLYGEPEAHTSFDECSGCVYAISMLYVNVLHSAPEPYSN